MSGGTRSGGDEIQIHTVTSSGSITRTYLRSGDGSVATLDTAFSLDDMAVTPPSRIRQFGQTLTDGVRNAITPVTNFSREVLDSIRFRLGYRAYWSGRFERAYRHLAPLAENGDCAAQYYLGRMFSRGEGVEADVTQAIRWWNASAGRGERWAQVEIGNLYETGTGIVQDLPKALKWYRRAADAGLAEAQVRVGYFFDTGLGVKRSHASARQWYIRAAVQGERNAYHNLAIHYAKGLGVPADKQKALAWLRKARPHQPDIEDQDLHQVEV